MALMLVFLNADSIVLASCATLPYLNLITLSLEMLKVCSAHSLVAVRLMLTWQAILLNMGVCLSCAF